MDIDALKALIAVHRSGSLAAASRELEVPRSTVRRRLDALEALVGAPLLHVGRDGTALTPAGRVLVEGGAPLATAAGDLVQAARTRARSTGGRLRLLMPHGFAPHILTMWYALARHERPEMQLEVRFHRSLSELDPETFDVAVQIAHRPPPGPWKCRVFGRVPGRLLATEGYIARHGRPETLDDLAHHDLALWVPEVGDDESLPLRDGGRWPVVPRLVTSNIAMVRFNMLAGQTLAYVPDGQMPDIALPTGPVEPVLEQVVGGDVPLWVIISEMLADDPKVRWMVERCIGVPPSSLTAD